MDDSVGIAPAIARMSPGSSLSKRLANRLSMLFRRLLAKDELASLSDRDLRDIGVGHRDIRSIVDRDMAKMHARDSRGH